MSKKVIIIHGYDSAPTKTKYTLISMALTEREIEHVIPALPGREHPNHKEWLEIINKEVQSATQPVVLVGHSLGTRAALLYLDQFDVKIDTVILIASFNNATENRSDGYANFFEHPLDLEKVKSRAKKFIVLHSKDDSAIDYKEGTMIAEELGAELITYEDKGHLSDSEDAEGNAKIFIEIITSVAQQ